MNRQRLKNTGATSAHPIDRRDPILLLAPFGAIDNTVRSGAGAPEGDSFSRGVVHVDDVD